MILQRKNGCIWLHDSPCEQTATHYSTSAIIVISFNSGSTTSDCENYLKSGIFKTLEQTTAQNSNYNVTCVLTSDYFPGMPKFLAFVDLKFTAMEKNGEKLEDLRVWWFLHFLQLLCHKNAPNQLFMF